MGSGIFSIGVSALQVAQLNLATTSHNIANASTDGYTRQRAIQASNIAVLTGAGYVGSGAHVSTIDRVYSATIANQVNSAQTKVSSLDAYSTEISSLDSLLSDANTGVSSALTSFFSSVSSVASDPTSLTTRQTFLSAARTLASRFQSTNEQINQQYRTINTEIEGYVSEINSYSKQIATLNQKIIDASAATGQQPNDLLDQRDQLVSSLNKLVGVKTTTNSNGSYNVYFGNGQPLVTSTTVSTLTATASSEDPSRIAVGVQTASGAVELPESVISGGSLGGVLSYRSETLDSAAAQLGNIAASVALTVNAQQALGQDLLGNVSGDSGFASTLFSISAPKVVANSNNPSGAATISASFNTPSYNSSTGTFYTNLTNSDYRLQYDGTNLQMTRLSDGVSWSVNWTTSGATTDAGLVQALNAQVLASTQGSQGFTVNVSGTLTAGSSYLLEPTGGVADSMAVNSTVAADVRLIAAAAPVNTTASSSNSGSAAITSGSVVSGYDRSNLPVTLKYDKTSGKLNLLDSAGNPITLPVTITKNGVSTGPTSTSSITYDSGTTISFNGISFKISGTPSDGDTYTVAKNTGGVSDSRNITLIGNLQTGKTMSGNSASYATVYSQLVSDVGNKAGETDTLLTAQKTVLSDAQSSRDSTSGVNLDEEAADLIKYQQAYQAAAKVLQIASTLFNSILSIGS